jgi:hypothetical protein
LSTLLTFAAICLVPEPAPASEPANPPVVVLT